MPANVNSRPDFPVSRFYPHMMVGAAGNAVLNGCASRLASLGEPDSFKRSVCEGAAKGLLLGADVGEVGAILSTFRRADLVAKALPYLDFQRTGMGNAKGIGSALIVLSIAAVTADALANQAYALESNAKAKGVKAHRGEVFSLRLAAAAISGASLYFFELPMLSFVLFVQGARLAAATAGTLVGASIGFLAGLYNLRDGRAPDMAPSPAG